mmetsp:Transcript_8170/g.32182  ORF Transcript_8170/g.32182 Transcript_8170/m.32182 type:complete len:214 (+) Transcript_8170:943-1584(+)
MQQQLRHGDAPVGVALEEPVYEGEGRGRRLNAPRKGGGAGDGRRVDGSKQLHRVGAAERRSSRQHLEQHRARRPQVAARIVPLESQELRRHVQRRATERLCHVSHSKVPREAKVAQLHQGRGQRGRRSAVGVDHGAVWPQRASRGPRRGQQDVLRLDVAVNQPARPERLEAGRQLAEEHARLELGHAPVGARGQHIAQVASSGKLKNQVHPAS